MSPVEKRIADYILANPELITKSTVVHISKEAGVSQGSITNFALSLGFPGFSQLKINLARNLPVSSENDSSVTLNSPNSILLKLIDSATTSFENTVDTISDDTIKLAADILIHANRIVLTGFAYSAPIAQDLAFRLMSIGLPAQAINDDLIAYVACSQLSENDVLLPISVTGRTKEILTCARMAKKKDAKVISFTSYARNPLSLLSDVVLIAVSNESHSYREAMTARLTQLVLGDCLVEYITNEIGEQAVERLDSVIEIFERNREARVADILIK